MNSEHRRAVLWDMDGTLLDSREYHWLAWREALAAEGFTLTYAQFLESFGKRNDAILRGFLGADLSPDDIARIGDAKEARYRRYIQTSGITLLPGVADWLQRLKTGGWYQAIASSAPRLNVETIVAVLNLGGYFTTLVSAEDVQRGKPEPDVFLLAAERMAVPPARCVVVEDAPAGIEAARRAGMRAIGVRSSHADLEADAADYVVASLAELPDDAFERLIG